MDNSSSAERIRARRASILRAGKVCFLRFGYAKTSMEDIAQQANVSRPLIYRQFASKEAVFAAIFDDLFVERYPIAKKLAAEHGRKRQRLKQMCELLVLEPWEEMTMGGPMAADLYEACSVVLPETEEKYQTILTKCVGAVLEDTQLTEVFILALHGLQADLPSTSILRDRVHTLVGRFVR